MFSALQLFFGNWSMRIAKQIQGLAAHMAAVEIWVVAICVAASAVSARLLPWAVGISSLFWGIRYLAYGYLSARTPADWPITLLALMIPVTLWTTALPGVTVQAVYRLLTGIALYYVIVNWAISGNRLWWLVRATTWAGLLLALGAFISVEWSADGELAPGFESLYGRLPLLVSDSVNPNVMAGALVLLLPCALASLLFGGGHLSWRQLIPATGAALLMVFVLILTQSRGGWMGLGASLIIMALLRWRRGWLLIPMVAIAGIIAVRLLGVVTVLNMLTANKSLGGLDTRLEVWSRALYMIEDFPLTGVGMGSFQEVAEVLYPFFTVSRDVPHAHNLFLQVAVDLGIPGLVVWLAIWMVAIVTAWQVYRHGRLMNNGGWVSLGVGLLGSQVALAVHGMVDAVTWGEVRAAVIVWAMWGLTMAAWNVCQREFEGYPAECGEESSGVE